MSVLDAQFRADRFSDGVGVEAEIEAMVRAEMEGVVKLSGRLVADLAFGANP